MSHAEAEKPQSLLFTGKSALVTTLIAVALNPISIIVGYYLSQSLQAPKLEISYVEPEYELESSKPSPALLAAWNKDPYFRDFIYQELQYANPVCRGWISENSIRSSCLRDILRVTRQSMDKQKYDKEKLEVEIKKISGTPNGQRLSLSNYFVGLPACGAADRVGCLDSLNSSLSDYNARLEVMEKFIAAAEELSRLQPLRTGRVRFHVGILNRGEADSVIPPDAELMTESRTLALRRAGVGGLGGPGLAPDYSLAGGDPENYAWSSRLFTPVKGRGFSEVVYEIDEGMSTGANKENFFAAIKNKSHAEFTLKIKTPDKSLSRSGDFTG
jgi:hypothetical protein